MKRSFYLFVLILSLNVHFLFGQCPFGDVMIEQQSHINAFSLAFPNCDTIFGSLIISGEELQDLSDLSNIKAVKGSLEIIGNDTLASLSGLDNIVLVDSAVVIRQNPGLTSIKELAQLTNVPDELRIQDNASLTDLIGLENVAMAGSVIVQQNPGLTCLCELSGLDSVAGTVTIVNNTGMISLEGLENLTRVGALGLATDMPITTLSPLRNLTTIDGIFIVAFLDSLKNMQGLESLNHIGGFTFLGYNDGMTDFQGLENLESVSGNELRITFNPALTSLRGLEGVKRIEGALSIDNNPVLASLDGFRNLTFVGGNLGLNTNGDIADLAGFDSLDSLGGLVLNSNGMDHFGGLISLRYLGDLSIVNEDVFTQLDGLLPNVSSISSLNLSNNFSLQSLTALNHLDSIGMNPTIVENANLSDCAINALCALIENGDTVTIGGNMSGCNELDTILASCPISSIQGLNEDSELTVFPNPVRDLLYISHARNEPIKQYTVCELGGRKLLSVTSPQQFVDLSALSPGFYLVLVTTEKFRHVRRVIVE